MVIHCKASPNPSFHTTAAESSPRGISCTSIAPMHGVSARPSTAPLEKGVRGVTGAERSRRHLPGRCWDHFATRAALSTQPLPQKSRPRRCRLQLHPRTFGHEITQRPWVGAGRGSSSGRL